MKKNIFLILAILFFFSCKEIKDRYPSHRTAATIYIQAESSSMSSAIFDNLDLESNTGYSTNIVDILKSRKISERAIRALSDNSFDFHLIDIRGDSIDPESVAQLQDLIKITESEESDIITIYIDSNYPDEAAIIINVLIDECIKMDQEWASGEMSHLKYFLREQLDIKEKELDEAEQNLKIFQEKEQIYGLDDTADLQLKFSRLKREEIILNETYTLIRQKLEEVKINEAASQIGRIMVLDAPISSYK